MKIAKFVMVSLMLTLGVLCALPNSEAQAQYLVGNRCQTPWGWCFMNGYAPIGNACFCPGAYGPVYGYVR